MELVAMDPSGSDPKPDDDVWVGCHPGYIRRVRRTPDGKLEAQVTPVRRGDFATAWVPADQLVRKDT